MRTYDASLKYKRDWENALETAKDEAREEGMEKWMKKGRIEQKIETAKQLKKEKIPFDIISRSTGLTIDEVEKL